MRYYPSSVKFKIVYGTEFNNFCHIYGNFKPTTCSMHRISANPYLIQLTLIATLGGLLFGYDTAVISGTVSSLKQVFIEPYNWPETTANFMHGLVVSSALIGCIIGGLSGGIISLKYGRRKGLIMAAALFLISALGSSMPELFFRPLGTADEKFILAFMIYRLAGGIGVGIASMLSPMYIAEISPANVRGNLVSWNQFAIIFGMLVVYFVNYSIALQGDDAWLHRLGWRWMFASEAVPAGLFLMLLMLIPETPRYLVIKGYRERALRILRRINGEQEAESILESIIGTIHRGTVSGRLFAYGPLVIIIGVLLAVFQQFVGINVVLYYAPEIFKNMGAGTDAALLQTIIVGIINLSFTILAIFSVDRWGRKPLQITGALGMAFFMVMLGFTFFLERVNLVSLICMLGYVACFALSWGPVTWVLLSEIFPNRIRGRAMALAVAAMWISNLIISWTFPILNNASALNQLFHHGFAYWIYGIMGILAALFIRQYVPETKGRSLEEIEHHWK
jgi:SP family xylose:H+ symportor-like MFS transporter